MWELEAVDSSLGSGLVHFTPACGAALLHMGATEIRGLFGTSLVRFLTVISKD